MEIALANAERIGLEAIAETLPPPPPVDYLAWAKRHIIFSERDSQYPGPYNDALFPYFSAILGAQSPDEPCRIVTLSKSAQLGGTALALIFCLGSLDMDPCDFGFNHPTEDNARRWSRMKLAPLIRNTPVLRNLFPERPRDGGDSVFYKERFDGRGAILASGANSPASLSQVTLRRQVQDDLSKWEANSAGDSEKQSDNRSRGHEFAKIFKISTPLVLPGCKISRNYEAGSQEQYYVPCPQCGYMQVLEWSNMMVSVEADPEHPEKAHFICADPECGGVIEEHHRSEMVRLGEWRAANPSAARYHRSFNIWSAYSPVQSWERIAREWLGAKGDPASEQTFMNDTAGQPYQTKGEAPPWEQLRDRADQADNYRRGTVPQPAVVLTLGIDCQADRVEWQLVGWGRDYRRYTIDAGVIPGHISEKDKKGVDVHQRLNELMRTEWPNEVGHKLPISLAAIDGNAWTEEVYGWVKRWPASKVIMMRGVGSDAAPFIARVKKERNSRTGKLLRYSKRFYNIGVSPLKLFLYRNLAKTDPLERGFVGLPRGFEEEWFQQLTAERRVPHKRKDGHTVYRWEKDPQQANEALDTHLQAEAAAIKFGVRTMPEGTWDRLEAECGTPPAEGQLDLEDIGAGGAAVKPKARARKRSRLSDLNKG